MTLVSGALVGGAIVAGAASLQPRLLRSPYWRATVTPLASIIGSGFLVAGPVISHAAGNFAWVAMAGLCAVAWWFGSAIRYNIAHVEDAADNPPAIALLERLSGIALAFAYFISVAYYLDLFGAFLLRGGGIVDRTMTNWVATAFIAALGLIGLLRGLKWLEHIEIAVVGLKLAMIGGLVAALAWADGGGVAAGTLPGGHVGHETGWTELRILLGLVILVQGFETSRYLGKAYGAATRIRTMRAAQWLSTIIYVAFMMLMTPWFTGSLPATGGETAIVDLLRPLTALAVPVIIAAALASQLSAGIADMNGSGGLIEAGSGGRVSVKTGYLISAVASIAIIWSADIFQIIAWASKAFVLYYAIQSVTAALAARRHGRHLQSASFWLAALLGAVIVALGIPAEGA